MCGFVGFTNKINDASIVLGKMMDRIKHRGPDSDGKYVDEQIAMGFRRLSIIDLSDQGSQPIFNEDKSLVLTFNGEIYNYKDLREELVASGHKFYTQTDSEVLIHGYEQWGENMLDKLRGMFAFVIFNKNPKRRRPFDLGLDGGIGVAGKFRVQMAVVDHTGSSFVWKKQ